MVLNRAKSWTLILEVPSNSLSDSENADNFCRKLLNNKNTLRLFGDVQEHNHQLLKESIQKADI